MDSPSADFLDRLHQLTIGHAGRPVDARVLGALAVLVGDIESVLTESPGAADLAWAKAATCDALGDGCRELGRSEEAARWFGSAATVWATVGNHDRAAMSQQAAADQKRAAGGSLDDEIVGLRAGAATGTGDLAEATAMVRLARIVSNVGDRHEAKDLVGRAAALLVELGWPDPGPDPDKARAAWLAKPHNLIIEVFTTWYQLLAVRGTLGDGWSPALATMAAQGDLLMADLGIAAPGESKGRTVLGTALAKRIDTVRDAYDAGDDTITVEALSPLLVETAAVRTEAEAASLTAVGVQAAVLSADLLLWGGRQSDAADVLADARSCLAGGGDVTAADRSVLLIEIVRRQVNLAALAQDDAAVSRLAGEAIAVVEADRSRLSLPYLEDDQLRGRLLLYSAGVAAARRRGDWELRLERADLVKARGCRAWHPDLVAALSVADLRQDLEPDEAVVCYWWSTPEILDIVTFDGGALVAERRLLEGAQRLALDALVTDLGRLTDARRWLDDDIPGLGSLLLPDDGGDILAGKRLVHLSPHGILHRLPLHAMTWRGRPLIESVAVSHTPNLAVLARRSRSGGRSEGAPVVVGLRQAPGRKELPRAEEEATAVADVWPGSQLLIGPDASRASWGALDAAGHIGAASILHLATHGTDGPPEDPLAATLVFVDGDETGTHLVGRPLRADLVVLSACWSAQRAVQGRDGGEMFADEVYGLQSAFLRAGARQVLGAMWPASDQVASHLMPELHRRLASGVSTAEALREVVVAARSKVPFLFAWAPYKLTAVGRPAAAVAHDDDGSAHG